MERERGRRQTYDHTDSALAVAWIAEIARDFTDETMPLRGVPSRPHNRQMARTDRCMAPRPRLERAHPSDQYLIKRVKRTAFGFHCRPFVSR